MSELHNVLLDLFKNSESTVKVLILTGSQLMRRQALEVISAISLIAVQTILYGPLQSSLRTLRIVLEKTAYEGNNVLEDSWNNLIRIIGYTNENYFLPVEEFSRIVQDNFPNSHPNFKPILKVICLNHEETPGSSQPPFLRFT